MTPNLCRDEWLKIRRAIAVLAVWVQFENEPEIGKRARQEVLSALRRMEHLCQRRYPPELEEGVAVLRECLTLQIRCRVNPFGVDFSRGMELVMAEQAAQFERALRMISAAFERWKLELPSDVGLPGEVAAEIMSANPELARFIH